MDGAVTYALDYQDDDTPVMDGAEPERCAHMATARRLATRAAVYSGRAIQVSTLDATGARRPRIVIRPDGGAEPPAEMTTYCAAGPGKPPCFCRNCRAARRRA